MEGSDFVKEVTTPDSYQWDPSGTESRRWTIVNPSLDEVLDRVATVHASDRYLEGGTVDDLQRIDAQAAQGYAPLLRHGVIGEGLVDYDRVFSTLAEHRFSGWLSIEDGEGRTIEEGMENLRRSVTFLRQMMNLSLPQEAHG